MKRTLNLQNFHLGKWRFFWPNEISNIRVFVQNLRHLHFSSRCFDGCHEAGFQNAPRSNFPWWFIWSDSLFLPVDFLRKSQREQRKQQTWMVFNRILRNRSHDCFINYSSCLYHNLPSFQHTSCYLH